MNKPNLKANTAIEGGTNSEGEKSHKVGALWKRESQKGYSFFSGQLVITNEFKQKLENAPIDKYGNKIIDVLVFNNKYKEQDNHPDYRIILGEPKKS